MTPEERRYLWAQARWQIAEMNYRQMSGVYVYAIADEMVAANQEVMAAAEALRASAP